MAYPATASHFNQIQRVFIISDIPIVGIGNIRATCLGRLLQKHLYLVVRRVWTGFRQNGVMPLVHGQNQIEFLIIYSFQGSGLDAIEIIAPRLTRNDG